MAFFAENPYAERKQKEAKVGTQRFTLLTQLNRRGLVLLLISFLYNRTLVCHDMAGGYIGDHWEDGCQVLKNGILREKANIMLIIEIWIIS